MDAKSIRDVLNLPGKSESPAAKRPKIEGKKHESIQRELYALLGDNSAPTMLQQPQKQFKSRPKIQRKPGPWVWAPFTNQARDDGLVLHHWVKGSAKEDEEYSYVKYNTKIEIPEISQDAESVIEQEGWSIDETKKLLALCSEYDLRWVVIFDRWTDEDTENPRKIEDLQERYYYVRQKLLEMKTTGSAWTADQLSLYNQLDYPKEKEIARKEYLEGLMHRTPAEVTEEEALLVEARKLEAAMKRMNEEREELLRLLDSPEAAGSIAKYSTSQGVTTLAANLMQQGQNKKKKVESTAAPAAERPQASVAFIRKKISAREEAAYGISWKEKLHPGIQLRSAKFPTFKASVQQKVNSILGELGLPIRPVIPTDRVTMKFEQLVNSIVMLLEAKKAVDRLNTEIATSK
ncbi:hypothetical protein CANCADRAFT_58621 [Tortispora caseinolytica NRRL Y-17796]|uniref:SWR1-complex protein 4 n=1 Tax=Tortispora caseinolytica NRRL Y-17796 TaxID=767744 RepID=A0A1E4TDI4_9ASCO|nr:hypothetical protein CANCADRAFT_58621 [Tortispora caseinolytica NRRL Y-17796]